MITIREEINVKYFDIKEDFKDFPEEFKNYIKIFRITFSIDFEIQLKDEFLQNKEIKNKILNYIRSKYINIEVSFTKNQLPF